MKLKQKENIKYTELELNKVAQQLRCPQGEAGKAMGDKMYITNTDMLKSTLPLLDITDENMVLEIGHGNCKHLDLVISKARNVKYFGLEISDLMRQEAENFNYDFVKNKQATFILYDGKTLPFDANIFDRIVTVNTMYFFDNPSDMLGQIYKILKPKGIFTLTFQKKEFIENLSFTKYDFNIFSMEQVREMLVKVGFSISEEKHKEDEAISKIGEKVVRKYVIIKAIKPTP